MDLIKKVHSYILKAFPVEGKAPGIKEIKETFDIKNIEDVIKILDKLEKKGCIRWEKNSQEIIVAYPYTINKTRHKVLLKTGKYVYAMCIIDALGIPFLINQDVTIVSECPESKRNITVKISKKLALKIDPPSAIVWDSKEQNTCPHTNIFWSEEYLQKWRKNNPYHKGESCTVQEAFKRGKSFADSLSL